MILRRCRSPRGQFAGCGDARRQTKIGRIRQSRRVAPQILASGRSGAGCGASGAGRFRTRERPCGDGPRRGGRSVFEASAVRKLKYERVRSALCHACAVPWRLFPSGKMQAGLLLRPLIPIFAGAAGRRAGRWRGTSFPQPAAAWNVCALENENGYGASEMDTLSARAGGRGVRRPQCRRADGRRNLYRGGGVSA